MRAPAPTPSPPPPQSSPQVRELWRGRSIVIKVLQCVETGKEIQTVKTEKKCSYPDARKLVQKTNSWLMPGAKPLFASVAAKQMVSCAVQTEVTWMKSDNPVRPKAPPPKGTQAGTQTSTPQQTPTKSSQVRPGRSLANKNPVELVDGVAGQKKTAAPARSASVSSRGKKSPGTRQTEKNGARSCEILQQI